MNRSSRAWALSAAALTALLLAGGGVAWHRALSTRAQAESALPPTPTLSDKQANLRDQISATETRVHRTFGSARGLAELSRIYHANGFQNEAALCYAGLEQIEPDEPRWWHLHATILAGYGQIDMALQLWRHVATLAPDYVPALLRIGDAELKANNLKAAEEAYQQALAREPNNAYAHLGLARLDFEAERWSQAQERLERVVANTNYVLGYDLIVSLYERTGQAERARAIRAAQKASGAYRDAPDPWVEHMMEACLDPFRLALTAGSTARAGDVAGAIRILERAIELSPEEIPARFQLGQLALEHGNLPLAREQFEHCTRIDPAFPDGWAQLSAVQEQLGEASAAGRTLSAGLAKCPQSPGLHLMQARAHVRAGRLSAAVSEFRQSIRLRPNEAQAYIEWAKLYMNQGQLEQGLELLRQSLEAEYGNPTALTILAYNAISTGDESTARQWCAQVRNQPRVPAEQAQQLWTAYRTRFGHEPP